MKISARRRLRMQGLPHMQIVHWYPIPLGTLFWLELWLAQRPRPGCILPIERRVPVRNGAEKERPVGVPYLNYEPASPSQAAAAAAGAGSRNVPSPALSPARSQQLVSPQQQAQQAQQALLMQQQQQQQQQQQAVHQRQQLAPQQVQAMQQQMQRQQQMMSQPPQSLQQQRVNMAAQNVYCRFTID